MIYRAITGIIMFSAFLFMIVLIELGPKCRRCRTRLIYEEGWGRFYCPKCKAH